MADNVTLNPGSGGALIGTDEIGGIHYPIDKIAFGAMETLTLVSTANPLPVDLRTDNLAGNLDVNLAASAVTLTIAGTVTANAGSGTQATQDTASLLDDAAFSPGTSRVLMIGATCDDVTPDQVNEGDAGALRMSLGRALHTILRDGAGNERAANVDAAGRLSVAVDSQGAIPAGNNNIGDVDVASLPAAALAAGNLVHVDYDTAGGGTQNMPMTGLALPASGGAVAGGTATNPLRTDPTGTTTQPVSMATQPLPSGASTLAEQQTQTAALQLIDNLVHSGDVALASYAVMGAVLDDSAPAAVTENQAQALRMTAARALHVALQTALPAGTNNIGDVDVLTMPSVTIGTMANLTESLVDDAAFTPGTSRVLPSGFFFDDVTPDTVNEGDIGSGRMSANRVQYMTIRDGAGNERGVNVDATNRLSVSVDNTPTVVVSSLPNEGQQTMANSISVAVASDQSNIPVSQATASALNAQVVGTVAHDSPDSGNPVKVGGVARTANPTAAAAGDRVDIFCDDLGKPVVYPIAPRDRIVAVPRLSLTNATETTLIAQSAGVFRDLVQLILSNESATEVRVDFRDTTAGAVAFSIDLYPDGGGAVIPFRVPWPQTTVNTNWTVQCSTGVTTVYVSALFAENN